MDDSLRCPRKAEKSLHAIKFSPPSPSSAFAVRNPRLRMGDVIPSVRSISGNGAALCVAMAAIILSFVRWWDCAECQGLRLD